MDETPYERCFSIIAKGYRNAPTPIVMKRQRRSSLSRFTLGHLLGNVEVYCQLSRGKLRVAYRNPWKMRDLLQANLISEAIALLGFASFASILSEYCDSNA